MSGIKFNSKWELHVIKSTCVQQYYSYFYSSILTHCLHDIKFHFKEFLIHLLLKRDSLAWTNSAVLGASFRAIVAASLFGWFGWTVLCLTIVSVSEALFSRILAAITAPCGYFLRSLTGSTLQFLDLLLKVFLYRTWPLESSESVWNKWTLWSNSLPEKSLL